MEMTGILGPTLHAPKTLVRYVGETPPVSIHSRNRLLSAITLANWSQLKKLGNGSKVFTVK